MTERCRVKGKVLTAVVAFALAGGMRICAGNTDFVVEDGVVTKVVTVPTSGILCFPSSVTAVDATLERREFTEIRSEGSLEYCNLKLEDCKVEKLAVSSENTTLIANGGSLNELHLTGSKEVSIVSVSCSGIQTISEMSVDANDVILSTDAKKVNKVMLGDNVEYVRIIGEKTGVQELYLGSEVCDFLATEIESIDTIRNNSDYLSVLNGCIYSYLEYEDYDCSGSEVAAPELVLCFYPMEKSRENGTLELFPICDMVGEEVFAGHTFQANIVIVPEGIRIVGEGAFANLPEETIVKFPQSLEYLDQDIFYDTSAEVRFSPISCVICNPYAFRGLMARELVIPDSLSFYYYNKSEEALKPLVDLSLEKVDKVIGRAEKQIKSPSIEQVEIVRVQKSRTGKLQVTWKGVVGAERYVICSAADAKFSKKVKKKQTKQLTVTIQGKGVRFVRVRAKGKGSKGKWSKCVKVM